MSSISKTLAFVSLAMPLALSKFFQETLYVMSYFMEKDFGTSATLIYQSAKYQPIGVALGYIATAFIVDRIGIKKVLSINMILMSLVLVGFSYNQSFEMLLFYRIALGMLIGTVYNCSFGGLPIIYEPHELPRKTSRLYMFAFLSSMLAPQILTITEPFCSWRTLLLMLGALSAFGGYLSHQYFPHNLQSGQNYLNQIRSLLVNKTFLLMMIVSTLCMGGFYGFVTLLMNNLEQLGAPSAAAKFIVADVQFISRAILFLVTTIGSVKLTQKLVNPVLKAALAVMCCASLGLLLMLMASGSVFGDRLSEIISLALARKHVFVPLVSSLSGIWLFWIYASLIGVAQPANKSKALAIAGKSMSGSAQAILGVSLSVGEFIFASITASSWPYGSYAFLTFVILSAGFVSLSIKKTS